MTQIFLVVFFVIFLIVLIIYSCFFIIPFLLNFYKKLIRGEISVNLFQMFAFLMFVGYVLAALILILYNVLV